MTLQCSPYSDANNLRPAFVVIEAATREAQLVHKIWLNYDRDLYQTHFLHTLMTTRR